MEQYFMLRTTPVMEKGYSNALPEYPRIGMVEAKTYKSMLIRTFQPKLTKIEVEYFPLSVGCHYYYEVCVFYNNEDADAIAEAKHIKENLPLHWDEEAKKEYNAAMIDSNFVATGITSTQHCLV